MMLESAIPGVLAWAPAPGRDAAFGRMAGPSRVATFRNDSADLRPQQQKSLRAVAR